MAFCLPKSNGRAPSASIGVGLTLPSRPDGKQDPRQEDGVTEPVKTTMYVQPEMTPPGVTRLADLIKEFTNPPAGTRVEDRLANKWKKAVEESMTKKMDDYEKLITGMYSEIKDQHKKVMEFVRISKIRSDQIESDSAQPPDEAPKRISETTPLAQPDKDTWDLAKDSEGPFDRWRSLISSKASMEVLKQNAKERLDLFKSEAGEAIERTTLISALKTLEQYETQGKLLDILVDVVRAFIANSVVTQNAFINIMLMGNPGTGKTRMARHIAQLLGALGMFIYKGEDYVEATRSDFIAQYEGQTAIKTRTFLISNLEKVVFLDEAYSLTKYDAQGELEVYGAESSTEIVKFLSDNVGRLAMLVAGYETQMKEDFLGANDGLTRRFPYQVVLEDYDGRQMVYIFVKSLYEAVYSKGSELKEEDVQKWFSIPSIVLLADICDAARRDDVKAIQPNDPRYATREILPDQKWESFKVYPQLYKIFSAQAGAMVNLANVAAILLMAEKPVDRMGLAPDVRGDKKTFYVDYKSMYNIVLTLLQRSLAGSIVVVTNEPDPSQMPVPGASVPPAGGIAPPAPPAGMLPPPPPPGLLQQPQAQIVPDAVPSAFDGLISAPAATGVLVAKRVEEWKAAKDQLDAVLINAGWLVKSRGPGALTEINWKLGDNVPSFVERFYPMVKVSDEASDSVMGDERAGGGDAAAAAAGSSEGMDTTTTNPAPEPQQPPQDPRRSGRGAALPPGSLRG